jgi:hypothetical protein
MSSHPPLPTGKIGTPEKMLAFTIDLESDYAGLLAEPTYELVTDRRRVQTILEGLKDLGVKTTVFVVGKLLETHPSVVEQFQKYDCDFQLHSYSHNVDAADSAYEIERGSTAFEAFFGRRPTGYRAPQWRISEGGARTLKDQGFSWDSSLCPSYFPNPAKYFFKNPRPHLWPCGLLELPATTIGPMRVMLSLSYAKLLGFPTMRRLVRTSGLPTLVCLNAHLHDFEKSHVGFPRLSAPWRIVYSRNQNRSHETLALLVTDVLKDYRSCTMSEMAASAAKYLQ